MWKRKLIVFLSYSAFIGKLCINRIIVIEVLGLISAQARASTVAFEAFPDNSTHSSAAVAEAIANVPLSAGVVYDENGESDDIQIWNYGTEVYSGSVDVSSTLQRIRDGDWMPTETDDGGFFGFYNGELPNIPYMGSNYYMEFVVWPYLDLTDGTYNTSPAAYGSMYYPGAMRLLVGLGGQVYFTGDHYGEDGPQQDAYLVYPVPAPEGSGFSLILGYPLLIMRKRRGKLS